MTIENNKRLIMDFLEAGNRGEMDRCVALLADDIVWRNMGTNSLSGTYRGKAELGEKLLGPLFGRLKAGIHMEVHQLVAEGDRVVAVMSGRAETLDGVSYNNQYCWLIKLRDGKMSEVTEFLDTALVQQVFG